VVVAQVFPIQTGVDLGRSIVVLMTLQNLRVIATSVRPFVLGLPFSLFFMLLLSFISTIVIVSIYYLWKDFRKRVAD
jgi:hypothetical protein